MKPKDIIFKSFFYFLVDFFSMIIKKMERENIFKFRRIINLKVFSEVSEASMHVFKLPGKFSLNFMYFENFLSKLLLNALNTLNYIASLVRLSKFLFDGFVI